MSKKDMLIDLIADWNITKPNGFIFKSKTEAKEFKDKYGDIKTSETFKTGLPKHLPNIKYNQFFDLHTLSKIKNVDTNINREEFVGITETSDIPIQFSGLNKYNALYNAYVCYKMYEKLKLM